MKRIVVLLGICLLLSNMSLGQQGGVIEVQVSDAETGDVLGLAHVMVYKNEVLKLIKPAQANGRCVFVNMKPDTFDIRIRYVGYREVLIMGVNVALMDTVRLEAKLEVPVGADSYIEPVEIIRFRKPVIEYDAMTVTTTLTRESIERMPVREVRTLERESRRRERKADAPEPPVEGVMLSGPSEVSVSKASHIKAGTLTAGEVNDFGKWELWNDIAEMDLESWQRHWRIAPKYRYSFQIVNRQKRAVVDALVELLDEKGNITWSGRTDNTGKAELWAGMFSQDDAPGKPVVRVSYKGKVQHFQNPSLFSKKMNVYELNHACEVPGVVDIAFVVDATGSMGDEISYLKEEISDVIHRFKDSLPESEMRIGSVFYRDLSDVYLTRKKDFTPNIDEIRTFISQQSAAGGGDNPEAVDAALEEAIHSLSWSTTAQARLLFLVLDAPPHSDSSVISKMHELSRQAARKGIRIIPLAASGTDRSTEYLMRSIALATNGTYLFLTDHSGVGNPHMEPITDNYGVELLNQLLLKVMVQFSRTAPCKEENDTKQQIEGDTVNMIDTIQADTTQQDSLITHKDTAITIQPESLSWKYYPNPTSGIFYVETSRPIGELFICDMAGKIIMRVQTGKKQSFQVDISGYPPGLYLIKFLDGEKDHTGKVILTTNRY